MIHQQYLFVTFKLRGIKGMLADVTSMLATDFTKPALMEIPHTFPTAGGR